LEKNIYREQEGTRIRKGQGEVGIIFVTEQVISLNQRKFTRFVLFYLSNGEIGFAIYDAMS